MAVKARQNREDRSDVERVAVGGVAIREGRASDRFQEIICLRGQGAHGGKNKRDEAPALHGTHGAVLVRLVVRAVPKRLLERLSGEAFGVNDGNVNHGRVREVRGTRAGLGRNVDEQVTSVRRLDRAGLAVVCHGLLGRVEAGLDAQALHSVRDRIVADRDRLGRDEVAPVRVVGVEDGLALALAPIEGRDLAVADAEKGARDVGIQLVREEELLKTVSGHHVDEAASRVRANVSQSTLQLGPAIGEALRLQSA